MNKIVIVDKDTLNKISVSDDNIILKDASIIHTKLHKEDVAEFVQDGTTLIVKLKNGDILTIENFFTQYDDGLVSDLVFEDDECAFLWFDFTNGVVSFKEIAGLEVLLPPLSSNFGGLVPWLVGGGLVVGGIIAATDDDKKETKVVPPVEQLTVEIVEVTDPVDPESEESVRLTGTVNDPEATVTVTVGGEDYPATVGEDGTWTVDVPANKFDGEPVIVEAQRGESEDPKDNSTTTTSVAIVPTEPTENGIVAKIVEVVPADLSKSEELPGTDIKVTSDQLSQLGDNINVVDYLQYFTGLNANEIQNSKLSNYTGEIKDSDFLYLDVDKLAEYLDLNNLQFGNVIQGITGNKVDPKSVATGDVVGLDWIYFNDDFNPSEYIIESKLMNNPDHYNNIDGYSIHIVKDVVTSSGKILHIDKVLQINQISGVMFADGTILKTDASGKIGTFAKFDMTLSTEAFGTNSLDSLYGLRLNSSMLSKKIGDETYTAELTVNGKLIKPDSDGWYYILDEVTGPKHDFDVSISVPTQLLGSDSINDFATKLKEEIGSDDGKHLEPVQSSIFNVLNQTYEYDYYDEEYNPVTIENFLVQGGNDPHKIDISSLLDESVNSANINNYVKLNHVDGKTTVSIDRDGDGSKYSFDEVMILEIQNQTTIEQLLQNNQLIYI